VKGKGDVVDQAELLSYDRGMAPISSCRVKEVSWHFQRSPMRISQAMIQSEDELHKDKHLRNTIEKLKRDLIKRARGKYFIPVA
jgi:hypothetical protein